MKKIPLLLLAVCIQMASFAALPVTPGVVKASSVLLPIGKSGQTISLQELAVIDMKDYQELTGRKMNLFERMNFRLAQRELKHSIAEDGTLNSKKLEKLAHKIQEGDTGFQAGGFFLGLLVGLIGVLIAYLINDDKKKNRVKWAWIGWGVWIAIVLIAVLLG